MRALIVLPVRTASPEVQMSRQEILFQENLRILTRSKSCAESFTDEEYEQHYKELMEQQGDSNSYNIFSARIKR